MNSYDVTSQSQGVVDSSVSWCTVVCHVTVVLMKAFTDASVTVTAHSDVCGPSAELRRRNEENTLLVYNVN